MFFNLSIDSFKSSTDRLSDSNATKSSTAILYESICLGFKSLQKIKEQVMDLVAKHFRPEFINRIDESVVFHSLTSIQIKQIADIQIKHLQQRLASQDIALDMKTDVLDYLAEVGFDPVYGARPLKRVIEHKLVNPLAQELLSGKVPPHSVIAPVLKGGEISFKIENKKK